MGKLFGLKPSTRPKGTLDSMPSSDELEQMKQNMYPCMACFCAEQSCTGDITPLCFTTGKVCCCVQSVGLECPPLWCEPDPCYSQERGICEVNQKMCCMYSEVQFPPSKDIGMGCCGVGCCRTSDDAPPVDEVPARSSHSSLFALQAASLGSNTAMAGSDQQLSGKGGKLSDMLVDFVEQCSLGSPPVSLCSLEA